MAVHLRHQIRLEIQARLVGLPHAVDSAGLPPDSLDQVKGDDDVPCAVVEIPDEEVSDRRKGDLEDGPTTLHRDPTITVWLVARKTSKEAIAVLEEMAVEVERRMAPSWNGLEFDYEGTVFDDEQRRGRVPFRSATLTFRVTYKTKEGAPDAPA